MPRANTNDNNNNDGNNRATMASISKHQLADRRRQQRLHYDKQSSIGTTEYSYVVLAVKILLVLLILLLLPQLVESRNSPGMKRKKRIQQKQMLERRRCERTVCKGQLVEENMNCLNECLSKDCFDAVYAANPLEDGEIDFQRGRDFDTCYRDWHRKEMIKSRRLAAQMTDKDNEGEEEEEEEAGGGDSANDEEDIA